MKYEDIRNVGVCGLNKVKRDEWCAKDLRVGAGYKLAHT
jgi:hypothetical protein